MAQPRLKMRLGDLLVQEQIISDDQLQLALQQQRQTGRKLGTTLIDLGFISEVQLLQFLARQLDVPFVNRIESPAQDADPGHQRTCPSPLMTYLMLVRASSPIGPLACIF